MSLGSVLLGTNFCFLAFSVASMAQSGLKRFNLNYYKMFCNCVQYPVEYVDGVSVSTHIRDASFVVAGDADDGVALLEHSNHKYITFFGSTMKTWTRKVTFGLQQYIITDLVFLRLSSVLWVTRHFIFYVSAFVISVVAFSQFYKIFCLPVVSHCQIVSRIAVEITANSANLKIYQNLLKKS